MVVRLVLATGVNGITDASATHTPSVRCTAPLASTTAPSVAQLSIDGADFWIQSDAATSPEALNGLAVAMILTVDEPDPFFASAVAAGATEVTPVSEDYGWRIGRVADPFGHQWEIGRRLNP